MNALLSAVCFVAALVVLTALTWLIAQVFAPSCDCHPEENTGGEHDRGCSEREEQP